MSHELFSNVVVTPEKPERTVSPRAERTGSVTTTRDANRATKEPKTREFQVVFRDGNFLMKSSPVRKR